MKYRLLVILMLCWSLPVAAINPAARGQTASQSPEPQRPSAGAASPSSPPTFAPAPAWERYQEIIQRSPFLRERSGTRRTGLTPGTEAGPSASFWTLRGIVLVNDQFVALLEESPPGRILRLRHGQSFTLGTVQVDGLDQISLILAEGVIQRLAVGQSISPQGALISPLNNAFSQERSTTPPSLAESTEAISPATGTPPAQGGDQSTASTATSAEPAASARPAASEVLERLRARRQQELAR